MKRITIIYYLLFQVRTDHHLMALMSVKYFRCRDKTNENNHDRTIDEVNGETRSSFLKKKHQKDNF